MNIIIAGLTGSGKTTHARLLSQELHLTYVSGSEIRSLLTAGKIPTNPRTHWLFSDNATETDHHRLIDPRLDIAVNEYLKQLVMTKTEQILDVWFLPWLRPTNSLKIWIECPAQIRAQRILRLVGSINRNIEHIQQTIAGKDARSREFAYKIYGIDIFADRTPFDVIITVESELPVGTVHTALNLISQKFLSVGETNCQMSELSTEIRSTVVSIISRCPSKFYPI